MHSINHDLQSALLNPLPASELSRLLRDEELIQLCKQSGVDLGLILDNLKCTLDQRVDRLQELIQIHAEVRNAPWIR